MTREYRYQKTTKIIRRYVTLCLLWLLLVCFSCSKKSGIAEYRVETDKAEISSEMRTYPGPPVIIYKTRGNYFDKVPVLLSEDRTHIIQFPDIKDLTVDGTFSYPQRLIHGFLLDKRGINQHVAFLDYSYEEYSNLETSPSATELFSHILDPAPILELYRCGSANDYRNPVQELNDKIIANDFAGFKKLK